MGVVEVGLLEVDVGAIGEAPLGVAEGSSFFLLDFALLGKLGNKRLVLHVVHVSLKLCGLGCGNSRLQRLGRGDGEAFLVGIHTQDNKVGVGRGGVFFEGFVDNLGRNHLGHL